MTCRNSTSEADWLAQVRTWREYDDDQRTAAPMSLSVYRSKTLEWVNVDDLTAWNTSRWPDHAQRSRCSLLAASYSALVVVMRLSLTCSERHAMTLHQRQRSVHNSELSSQHHALIVGGIPESWDKTLSQAVARIADRILPHSTFGGHVTPSVMWPFDSPYAISYWWSFVTKPLSLTVSDIFNVKCNAMVDVTLIRPLNKGSGHWFWYQSISHIRLPIGSQ